MEKQQQNKRFPFYSQSTYLESKSNKNLIRQSALQPEQHYFASFTGPVSACNRETAERH